MIYQGSILDVQADCIVNPANSHLQHGGGLARIIADAATPNVAKHRDRPELWDGRERAWLIEHRNAPLVATGDARMTSAGHLPYKGVIHAVGPVWGGGSFCEDSLLFSAHQSAFAVAHLAGFKTIAVPAISCGIFGFPVERAAPIASAAARYATLLLGLDVTFALMEQTHIEAYEAAGA